jgi:hypothetical protein
MLWRDANLTRCRTEWNRQTCDSTPARPLPGVSFATPRDQILAARNRALRQNSVRRPPPDLDALGKSRTQLYGSFVMVDSAGECKEEDEN